MNETLEHELEAEIAGELEGGAVGEASHEAHESHEHEGELGSALEGELLGEASGELLGEGEGESEGELGSLEHGEQFLGNLVSGIGSLLGQGEGEGEGEGEAEYELEGESGELEHMSLEQGELGEMELEQGEQFFRRALRGIGRLASKAAPILKSVARVAAPVVGKAVGGLFGGPAGAVLGSKLASLAARQLREQELAGAHELGLAEHEMGEQELGEHEVSLALGEHEAHAEALAHFAAASESAAEAEALAGAAVTMTLSARDRRALRALVPHLVRGAALLTRILRMRRATRPFVRVIPTIMRRTAGVLRRSAASGQRLTRQRLGRIMARQTRRVLTSPRYCAAVLARNVQATRSLRHPARLVRSGHLGTPAAGRRRRGY